MTEIEQEIEQAVSFLQLNELDFKKLPIDQAKIIVDEARLRFVIGNPRSWWLSLSMPATTYNYSNSQCYLHIKDHWAPPDDKCFFIPEIEHQSLAVFHTTIANVQLLLQNCSFFEYYILSQTLDFLLIENDHNEILVTQVNCDGKMEKSHSE